MDSKLLRLIVLVIILAIPSYLIYKDYSSSGDIPTVETSIEEVVENGTGAISEKGGIGKKSEIKIIPVPSERFVVKGPVPDLNKAWSVPSDYSVDAKRILDIRVSKLNEELKTDYNHYDKWIDLGILRKMVGDYNEAINIWEFAARNWPDSFVAYHNLGDVYAFYLKDYDRAEKNMLKVIEIDPNYALEYRALHSFYKMSGVNLSAKAEDILIQGLDKNPKSVDLIMLLATHYKEGGDRIKAKKYYEMALIQVGQFGDAALQRSIEEVLKEF